MPTRTQIDMIKVTSRNLDAVGYDRKNSSLYIRFIGNKTYRYSDVPKLVWKGLQLAESKGSFFQKWIVGNFDYEVVDETELAGMNQGLITTLQ